MAKSKKTAESTVLFSSITGTVPIWSSHDNFWILIVKLALMEHPDFSGVMINAVVIESDYMKGDLILVPDDVSVIPWKPGDERPKT